MVRKSDQVVAVGALWYLQQTYLGHKTHMRNGCFIRPASSPA
jgi:hypothetical protein